MCGEPSGWTNLIEMRRNGMHTVENWWTIDEYEQKITKYTLTFSHSSLWTKLRVTKANLNRKGLKMNGKT